MAGLWTPQTPTHLGEHTWLSTAFQQVTHAAHPIPQLRQQNYHVVPGGCQASCNLSLGALAVWIGDAARLAILRSAPLALSLEALRLWMIFSGCFSVWKNGFRLLQQTWHPTSHTPHHHAVVHCPHYLLVFSSLPTACLGIGHTMRLWSSSAQQQ